MHLTPCIIVLQSLNCLTAISFLKAVTWLLRKRISLTDHKSNKSFLFMSVVFHWMIWLREVCSEVLQLGTCSNIFPNNRFSQWWIFIFSNSSGWYEDLLWPFSISSSIFFHCVTGQPNQTCQIGAVICGLTHSIHHLAFLHLAEHLPPFWWG